MWHEEPSEEILGIEQLLGWTLRPLVAVARHFWRKRSSAAFSST
jgi:hypothetical protein